MNDPENRDVAEVRAAVRPARRRLVDFALSRIRQSRVLQALAVAAFVEYGAVAMLHVFAEKSRRIPFELMGWMVLCALGSWFFLLAWYPFLETLMGPDSEDPRHRGVGRVLEGVAMACVGAVHLMLGIVLVWGVRGTS